MNASAMCMMTITGCGAMGNGAKNGVLRVFSCTKAEFTKRCRGWWESCGFETKEQITGLKVCDSPASETRRTFIDAADQWWNSRDYEHKRKFTTGIILKRIICELTSLNRLATSCSCSHMEAQNTWILKLVPSRVAGGGRPQEDDIEMACSNLGLDLDNQNILSTASQGINYPIAMAYFHNIFHWGP